MRKHLSFVKLDLLALKPDLKRGSFVLYFILMGTGYFAMGAPGLIMGFYMMAGFFTTFVFSAGKSGGLDALYNSLGISRKDVVIGRYIFTMAVYIAVALAYVGSVMLLAAVLQDDVNLIGTVVLAFTMFFVMRPVMDALSMPLIFKLGFKRARLLGMLLPMLPFMGVAFFASISNVVDSNLQGAASGAAVTGLVADAFAYHGFPFLPFLMIFAAVFVVFAASCLLSIKLYSKREF